MNSDVDGGKRPKPPTIFEAKSVAVVGASPSFARAGGRVLSYLYGNYDEKHVYPVNPRYTEITNHKCYSSVSEIPDQVDVAMLCIAAEAVPDVVRECGKRGIGYAVVHSDGFGDSASELYQELLAASRDAGVRIVGPNTNGFRAVNRGLIVEAGTGIGLVGFRDGPAALVGQSGGLGGYFGSTYLMEKGGGTRYVVDTGNEMDFDVAEALTLVSADPEVRTIGLILEGCPDGRKLVEAIRRSVLAGKRVFVVRIGRTEAGRQAAVSHTGSIAGQAEVFEQIVTDAGATVCVEPGQLTSCLALAGAGIEPNSGGVGIVAPSGGFAILALDLADRYGIPMGSPTTRASSNLQEALGDAAPGNPVDISGQYRATAELLGSAVGYLLEQPDVPVVVVWQPHHLFEASAVEGIVEALVTRRRDAAKCVVVCGMVPPQVASRLHAGGVLTFSNPDELFSALGLILAPGRPRHGGRPSATVNGTAAAVVSGAAAREIVATSGIQFARTELLATPEHAIRFRQQVGRPIVLKVEAPHLAHKADLGLVSGPLRTDEDVRAAFERLAARMSAVSDGRLIGQEFVEGVEVAVGTIVDASFGPVVMVGMGGALVEMRRDVAFATAPIDEEDVSQLLDRLEVGALLRGYRGSPARDIDALVRAVAGLSRLAAEGDSGAEIEVNPLIVGRQGEGAIGVDCVIVR